MRYLNSVDPTGEEIALLGGITDRKLGALRLILSSAALLIIYIDPTEPDRYVQATYSSIVAYTVFSFLVYLAARQRTNFSNQILNLLIWFDIACFTALISMSSGTSSVFYFFYMFEIIVACSRGGRRLGLAVTAASSLLCVAVGLLVHTNEVFELNRFLLRPLAIIALGYMLAYWGGTELALRKRLILLKQLSTVANPRFGVDRTIDQMLQRIVHFYNADLCVMILDPGAESQLYLAPNRNRPDYYSPQVTEENSRLFLSQASDSCPEMFIGPTFLKRRSTYRRYDPRTNKVTNLNPAPAESLARVLGARSLIATPFQYREHLRGRLLLSSHEANAFEMGDAVFLLQAANQVLPWIENIRLVDRLASDASEAERQRIARSVHDRVIQPYYGLQIGLKALQGLLQSESRPAPRVSGKPEALLGKLMNMTNEGINELREYVYGLKQTPASATRLADSIRRFAGKFEGATGIQVRVDGGNETFAANDRLTAEVFQMTTEALSNIHRHTQSRSAHVMLNLENNNLVLQVENDTDPEAGRVQFSPSSIAERADALGGNTEVSWQGSRTILKVEVPL